MNFYNFQHPKLDKIVSYQSSWVYLFLTVWCLLHYNCVVVVSSASVGSDKNGLDLVEIKESKNTNTSQNEIIDDDSPLSFIISNNSTSSKLVSSSNESEIMASQKLQVESSSSSEVTDSSVLVELPTPLNPSTKDIRLKGPVNIRVTTSKPSVVFSDDDQKARKDWEGNCTNKDWVKCSHATTFGEDTYDEATGKLIGEQLSCANETLFPPICLYNGWTVTRCHLMCLAKECNRDLKIHYDKYVSKDGFC